MGLFSIKPPKTTIENLINISHLEKLLLWFLKNDKFFSALKDKNMIAFFNAGWGRDIFNGVEVLFMRESPDQQNIFRYLVILMWRDLVSILENMQSIESKSCLAKDIFAKKIDQIGKETDGTIQECFMIAKRYNIDFVNFDSETDLIQLEQNILDAVKFKTAFVKDVLLSSEMRLLAWIYKDLFGKEYKIVSDPQA